MWKLIVLMCLTSGGEPACGRVEIPTVYETQADCEQSFAEGLPKLVIGLAQRGITIVDLRHVCEQMGEGV